MSNSDNDQKLSEILIEIIRKISHAEKITSRKTEKENLT